jgi:hypothetical protein
MGKQPMDPELVDRIYECSVVPELWPGVLDEIARKVESSGGSLLVTKAEVQYWAATPGTRERAEKIAWVPDC